MSPIAIMRFAWSSDYGKHTVWNVLYKISIIVAKVREVNILLQGTISDLLEDTIDKHENQKEGDDYE
jgi:hypothetical protein